MKIKLPKEPRKLKGFAFDMLFTFEMNNFDVEALLPTLFYLIRSGGRQRGKLTDPTNIDARRDALAQHKSMVGFDSADGLRVLDKWIRTSFVETARRGRSWRKGEQIFYIRPLSFLSYKPGFPAEGRRVRGVPAFVYQILTAEVPGLLHPIPDAERAHGSSSTAIRGLRFIQDTFAEGLQLDNTVQMGGRYDGHTRLDVETVGLFHYLDGFEPCPPSVVSPIRPPAPALARSARRLAQDVALLITAYRDRVPSRTLAQFLAGLLNFEMFVYTLELQYVTNRLAEEDVVDPYWVLGKDDLPSPVRSYVDMVGDRHHLSARMAQEQVEDHFTGVQHFLRSNLLLRTLHRYINATTPKPDFSGPNVAHNLQQIAAWRSDPKALARAGMEKDAILEENGMSYPDDMPHEISQLLASAQDEVDAVLRLLEEAQRSEIVNSMLKWYRSVGGLGRSDGILEGNVRGRRAWRLQMSEGLLEILVQLCCVMPGYADVRPDWNCDLTDVRPRPVSLANFLRFLEERYGIIIDRPPDWMRSVETVAAAKENFEALKRRLRQMGVFEDLSDDFNAQYIEPRYVTERDLGSLEPALEGADHD
ncbi:MAG: hypothetical protein HPY44_22255 [Armatimonadetes bacterium]|nr:hypothetical protein [Armatimonadota bacterium]